jgi:hypothetical protein
MCLLQSANKYTQHFLVEYISFSLINIIEVNYHTCRKYPVPKCGTKTPEASVGPPVVTTSSRKQKGGNYNDY